MTFNSLNFIFFFIILFLTWCLFSTKKKWIPLLTGSYFFYFSWDINFAFILLFCTIITYFFGNKLYYATQHRKVIFFVCVSCNIGILFIFKYLYFVTKSLNDLLYIINSNHTLPYATLFFPIGISFFTFQSVSYLSDIYKKEIKPETHFGYFALYLAFFPKLISGPIERASNLLPQLHSNRLITLPNIYSGLTIFFWGLFKKIVIADRLALYVNMVYQSPHDYSGKTLLLASYYFTIQIYCDFSGYTDMAIGCARIFGIELTQNFRFPYLAASISEFWRRWHISLTSWFRDYLYIPLGGNRIGAFIWQRNILIVFLISGLWHGANWTFIVWGGIHGLFLLLERQTQLLRKKYIFFSLNKKLSHVIKIFITFNIVSLAWIFFKATSISDAGFIITHIFYNFSSPLRLGASRFSFILTAILLILFLILELLCFFDSKREISRFKNLSLHIRYSVYIIGILTIALCSVSNNQFIYFHF